MRGYYAFAWWRYDHAVHPMTTAAILETGFLTSPSDQRLLVKNPQKVAEGVSKGIINYLEKKALL
jgi:N-acetylmuramoyl-L-alanine amidase